MAGTRRWRFWSRSIFSAFTGAERLSVEEEGGARGEESEEDLGEAEDKEGAEEEDGMVVFVVDAFGAGRGKCGYRGYCEYKSVCARDEAFVMAIAGDSIHVLLQAKQVRWI